MSDVPLYCGTAQWVLVKKNTLRYGLCRAIPPPHCGSTSLITKCLLLGPKSKTMPRALRWSDGGGSFL